MNTQVVLPLDKMTLDEKLEVLDLVWADITRDPHQYPSPEWHGEYLKKLEARLDEGEDQFIDIDDAERRILDMTS